MDEPREFTLAEIAEMTHSTLVGDPNYRINKLDHLHSADASSLSFLDNPHYLQHLKDSKAGAIFVDSSVAPIDGKNFLITTSPCLAFQTVLKNLIEREIKYSGFKGIHPSAIIHSTCQIGHNVTIGPGTVIDQDVIIQDNTVISSQCYIGPECYIGYNCHLHPRVVIREQCRLGNRVVIQPGAVIGGCGFGYYLDEQNNYIKLSQVGNVVIEDEVEIGANTTIDRAQFGSTIIKKGTKIDNLVQIGHNVTIGEQNILIAQVGIAGFTITGKYDRFGGQAGVVDHVKISDEIGIAAQSAVHKDIEDKPGTIYRGSPAIPINQFNRNLVLLRNIEKYVDQIKALQREMDELKARLDEQDLSKNSET